MHLNYNKYILEGGILKKKKKKLDYTLEYIFKLLFNKRYKTNR